MNYDLMNICYNKIQSQINYNILVTGVQDEGRGEGK